MKFNLITRKNNVGQLRLLFSYQCKSRRFFATGVIIPPEDYEPGRLERPVRKTCAKAEHYNKQIHYSIMRYDKLTLQREDKLPTADLVHQIQGNEADELPVNYEGSSILLTNCSYFQSERNR